MVSHTRKNNRGSLPVPGKVQLPVTPPPNRGAVPKNSPPALSTTMPQRVMDSRTGLMDAENVVYLGVKGIANSLHPASTIGPQTVMLRPLHLMTSKPQRAMHSMFPPFMRHTSTCCLLLNTRLNLWGHWSKCVSPCCTTSSRGHTRLGWTYRTC